MQDKGNPFDRSQAFKHHHIGLPQAIPFNQVVFGFRLNHRRPGFGQPLPDIIFTLATGRFQNIKADIATYPHQPRRGIADVILCCRPPAQPDILHGIFGIGMTAQHAIGQGMQPPAMGFENLICHAIPVKHMKRYGTSPYRRFGGHPAR